MPKVERSCLQCKINFKVKSSEVKRGYGKFCSKKCASLYKTGIKKAELNRSCDFCHKMFRLNPSREKLSKSGFHFCSRKCKDTAQRLENGFTEMLPPHYGKKSDNKKEYRSFAFKRKGKKCERCGYDKYPDILEIHHKDRDRSNNEIENLESLCPTCHMEQHYIEKTGRYWRRKKHEQYL